MMAKKQAKPVRHIEEAIELDVLSVRWEPVLAELPPEPWPGKQ
jgi:hypothetical protein